ncbi:related to TGL4 - triacylglycerol lipase [Cephalotrichum gorgonifer]|uniref:Patatin-like phospholipase domain-containing protein n=1 Tax=Cephalotrichum gorgonifer TaxID=2041049 RepID=A0AAE8SZJ9_9PEZI|nr:related to TGL4 - triacylglycerol lipase [Cephalotrichum gorgonifer]
MTGLLLGADFLGRSALLPSKHAAEPKTTSTPKEAQNHVALRTLSRAFQGANNFALTLWDGLTVEERQRRRVVEERKSILIFHMKNADSLEQWEAAAQELDLLEGNDKWKLDPTTGGCNTELIESRLKDLDDARETRDARAMVHLVRTALSRDLGGMGRSDLYHHSHIGTKQVIERYVDSATETIGALMNESSVLLASNGSYRELLEDLLFARQSFGRSALLLSGGATFGMMHIGVLKTLFAADLLPRIISGASAGSIVCAVFCTRTDEEIPDLIKVFPYGDLGVFDEEGCPTDLASHVRKLLTEGSWSDVSNLSRVMRALLGELTFQEAYNRTRRILNITVSSESIYELPRLLNYVTAPNVMIWSAVAASCSVPLVFTSASLLVKDPITGEHVSWNATPQRWIDGSVDNDLPITRLSEMFNVNHFIVSQVNPHVVPFLAKEENIKPYIHSDSVAHGQRKPGKGAAWLSTMTSLARDEALHRLHFLAELGIAPNLATKLQSVLSQRYSGDINILPEIAMQDIPRILVNPTSDFMLRTCLAGERATWPKISRIRDRCAIELALDRAVLSLRARVVFSESQVDLRRMLGGPFFYQIGHQDPTPQANEATQTDAQGDQDGGDGRCRRRRGSGSSVQLLVRQREMLRAGDGTGNGMTGEDYHEALGTAGEGPSPGRRKCLRRAATSQYNVRMGLKGILTNDAEADNGGVDSPTPPELPHVRVLASEFPFPKEDEDYEGWLSLEPGPEPLNCDDGTQTAQITPEVEVAAADGPSSDGASAAQTDGSLSDADPYGESWLREMSDESAPVDTEEGPWESTTEATGTHKSPDPLPEGHPD